MYFKFILAKYDTNLTYNISTFLKLFLNEYRNYGKDMIDVTNKIFDYQNEKKLLVYKLNFTLEQKDIPDSINNVISHLFEAIENRKDNYQAFYCLMNIAHSYPTLLSQYSEKMFNLAYYSFDFLFLIYEKKEDDEHLPLIKAGYSALLLILASLQSPMVIDAYFKWIFGRIEKLNHTQILCTFIILNALNSDNRILNLSLVYVIKYNFFETIAKFLKRNIEEGYFLSCYKSNIYKYITDIYSFYSRCNMFIIAQKEELMKKENPFSFAFNEIFLKIPYINIENINIDANSTQLDQFIKNASKLREFWISYKFEQRNKTPTQIEIKEFISNISNKTAASSLISLPTLKTPITFHMSKYLTMQKIWAYSDLLYSIKIPLTSDMFNYLNKTINHLNILRDYADNHPDEDDEINCDSFSVIDYFLPQYSQDSLIKNLISDLYLPSLNINCFSSLCELFVSYTSNNIGLLNFLSVISQSFSDIYEKCIGFAPHSLLKVMCNLIEILEKMTDVKGFKEKFFETCGNNLINIVLCPELRNDLVLLLRVSNLMKEFNNLPIRVTQIIYFMFITNNEKVVSAAISLSSKFSHDQLGNLNQFILAIFDMEINNEKRMSMISTLVKYSSVILDERESKIFSILKGLFKNFTTQKNEKIIDLMCSIMNKLAPVRTNFDNLSPASEKITEIPQYIKETNPKFWNLFEKYIEPFNKMINENHGYLSQFKFLFEYPELVSFKTRSIYFRKKMKELINYNDELVLHIDLNNILMSSYYHIIDETTENLLKRIYVIFGTNTKTVDYGGPTREFLTKLAKEIFNVKYGLFEISKNMTYQPSKVSYIQNDYLNHFRFAGIFVARALIEGQCIDAHLTTSFLKQILHLKPSLKDLEDFDEQLYNSLNWMLNNDVESLDMYFEISYEEFGVHKTIPLIENGSQIKVTNENKKEFIELNSQFYKKKIEEQVKAFCDGFDSLIPHEKINYFAPKELDLLICGVTDIDVEDFIENTVFEVPLTKCSPIVQMLFNVIRSWDNDKLSKLLYFMTGSPKVPANGFKEFVQITGFPLKIEAGGDENALPQAHTCFNTIDLPSYRNEKELNNKLLYAIQECNTFELL